MQHDYKILQVPGNTTGNGGLLEEMNALVTTYLNGGYGIVGQPIIRHDKYGALVAIYQAVAK